MVLAPGHQGPNLQRCSARRDGFPAAVIDIVGGDVFQRLVVAAPVVVVYEGSAVCGAALLTRQT